MNTLSNKSLTIIGVGNIGRILLQRLTASKFPAEQLTISDIDPVRLDECAADFGVKSIALTDESIRKADIILIATPPTVVLDVLESLSPNLQPGQIIVSFAAAISIQWIEKITPIGVGAARVMPNAPSLIGQGCNPVVYGKCITEDGKLSILELLELLGETIPVSDEQMNWCVGLTGAAMRTVLPAIQGMIEAGLEAGLSISDSRQVAAQIMLGTAALVKQTDLSFEQIKALTPMQTVDELALAEIFLAAARQAKEKIDNFQQKLEPKD